MAFRDQSFSLAAIDPNLLDLNTWLVVNEDLLSSEQQDTISQRRRAIELLVNGESGATILKETEIDRRMAVYWLMRCLEIHPDGQIYGYRALVSYSRLKVYRRTAPVEKDFHISEKTRTLAHGGWSGAFGQLLRAYPELQKMIERHSLKLNKANHVYESRIPLWALHNRFLTFCREKGLDVGRQYPFNTRTLGHRSLSTYVRALIFDEPDKSIRANYGTSAAQTFKTGDGTMRPITVPFERVELDAHHIDAIFTILIPNPFGDVVQKVLFRIWVLVIKETISGAVLAYHRSFRKEPDSNDVLEVISKALTKWAPRKLRIPGLTYAEGAGFPSSYDSRFLGACWEETSVDEALSINGKRVQRILKEILGRKPATLKRHNANDRPFVEGFFHLLEEMGFHRLPNTTGSNPQDTRRDKPERAALRFKMQLEELDELLDVMQANYNAKPSRALGGRPPLAYLLYLCSSKQCWPRLADHSKVSKMLIGREIVTVRGDMSQGRRPHINFGGVKYTNAVLSKAFEMIGQNITIEIPKDIRTVRAIASDGLDLGILVAAPRWHLTPHTYEVRQETLKCARDKSFNFLATTCDPVIAYIDYKEECIRKGAPVTPEYLEQRELLVSHWRVSADDKPPRDDEDESAHERESDDDDLMPPLITPRKAKNG